MKHKKLVVFDWNGTVLADTLACWRASNECLKFFGVEPISLEQYRETVNFPVIHFYKLNGACVDTVLERQTEANDLFYDHYTRNARNARTRRGLRALLKFLKERDIDATILSNYMTVEIEKTVERLNLGQFFVHICGNGDPHTVLQHATKKDRLSAFMLKRGYRAENTTLIGDSTEEPEIAHHLGLKSISITGGYFSERRLKASNPTHIVKNLQDVIEIFDSQ